MVSPVVARTLARGFFGWGPGRIVQAWPSTRPAGQIVFDPVVAAGGGPADVTSHGSKRLGTHPCPTPI